MVDAGGIGGLGVAEQLAALESLAKDIARSAEGGLSDPGLGEIESFRMAHAILAERGVLKYAVPAHFGGADVAELAGPDTVSVRALATLRRSFAFHHAMLDLARWSRASAPDRAGLRGSTPRRARTGR